MNKKISIKILHALFLLMGSVVMAEAKPVKLQEMTDAEMSNVNGQALMSLSYTSPTDSINKMNGQNVGFYKLGLEGELELNANIKKIQLGCGGVNGAGGCDIDIDNLSISGISETQEGRVGSDAKLTNPFLEFAIKNPNSASTREMIGVRLSAEKALGMLSLGNENSTKANGINSLSGYLNVLSTTGVANTASRNLTFPDTNIPVKGSLSVLFGLDKIPFSTSNYNLALESTTADLNIFGTQITGTRIQNAILKGQAAINQINVSGSIVPTIVGITVPININVTGNITGITADVDISENLGFIHKIQLNNPLSLSLQNQKVFCPGATVEANRGWWLAVEDSIDIGKITPSDSIAITNDVLTQAVPKINDFLAQKTMQCTLLSCIFGLDIGNINLTGSSPVNFPIKDVQLATQNFAPNCYGSLKFC